MPDNIPLRDHMEQLFEQQNKHIDQQFKDVRAEIRFLRRHKHGGYVRWVHLGPLLVSLAGLAAGAINLG